MAQVKFVSRSKYKGVRYPAHTPFEVADEDVNELVKSGAIVTVPPAPSVETLDVKNEVKKLDEMTVPELKAYAKEHDVDISGKDKKAEILEAIEAAVQE